MRWFFAMMMGVLLVLHSPPHVSAQDAAARAATARAMFEQGLSFVDAGNWADAADRFRRALALKESHVIRYNLASALIELGKLIEASELLRQIVNDGAADAKVRAEAQEKLEQTTPRLASLIIQLDGTDKDVVVQLDEHALDPVMLGVSIPTDPGNHQLKSTKGAEILDELTISLADGEARELTLRSRKVATPTEAAKTVVTPESTRPAEAPEERAKSSSWMWWGIGGGAVVATVAVIAVIAATSSSEGEKPASSDFEGGPVYVKVSQ